MWCILSLKRREGKTLRISFGRGSFGITAGIAAISCFSTPAFAQAAAESAVVTAGTAAPAARGGRSLGSAVSGSINSAAGVIRQGGRGGARPARRGGGAVRVSRQGLPAGVDALEGTDATAYKLENGVTIKVSGRMPASAKARCVEECGAVSVQQRPVAPVASDAKPTAD